MFVLIIFIICFIISVILSGLLTYYIFLAPQYRTFEGEYFNKNKHIVIALYGSKDDEKYMGILRVGDEEFFIVQAYEDHNGKEYIYYDSEARKITIKRKVYKKEIQILGTNSNDGEYILLKKRQN